MNEAQGDADDFMIPDGEILKKKVSATYLGNNLNTRADLNVEVAHKICETRRTWLRLAAYWKATEASTKWHLLVFDAVVRSKLMYAALPETLKKNIDSFQRRSLRQILKLKHPYYER